MDLNPVTTTTREAAEQEVMSGVEKQVAGLQNGYVVLYLSDTMWYSKLIHQINVEVCSPTIILSSQSAKVSLSTKRWRQYSRHFRVVT